MKLTNATLSAALLLCVSGFASADVLLTASASPNSVKVGGASTITVTLSDNPGANAVSGFQFDVDFNAAVLQATTITEEGYFASNGLTGLTTYTINNKVGTITLIADAAGTPEDPGKGDPLVAIGFNAIHAGSSPITIANVTIAGPNFNTIAANESITAVNVTSAVPEPQSYLLVGVSLILGLLVTRSANRPRRRFQGTVTPSRSGMPAPSC
jgi:hypothetical protein